MQPPKCRLFISRAICAIDTIRIENFRCFEDTTIPMNKFTAFVGANGAGKSTVLCALNVFFKETTSSAIDVINLVKDDFHNRNDKEPIRITVHFAELGEVANGRFQGIFQERQTYNNPAKQFLWKVLVRLQRSTMGSGWFFEAFVDFFKALNDGARVDELRVFYNSLRDKYGLAKETTKDRMTAALRAYEEERPTECVLKPSEDHFYGATKGAGKLNKHVQWVYVPAVKDATSEEVETRAGSLGKLLARQVRTKVNFWGRSRRATSRFDIPLYPRCSPPASRLSIHCRNHWKLD